MTADVQASELATILGANIRARRKELGLTQQALADRVDVTQAFIAQIETGVRSPDVKLLAPLADTLKTTPDALLTPNVFSAV